MPMLTLGNYRVTARIGHGGMGEVFLAEHQRISRRAAIKVLNRDIVGDPQMVARFLDEARAMSRIHSDGVAEIYDCDVDPSGRAYIVMEYLEGETLAARLRRHARLGWVEACEITRQIAVALSAAHAQGVVHRDLKPANVFLVGNGAGPQAPRVKVLDFGIAKLLTRDPDRRYRTSPGALVGTPEYMSPEQCCGIGWIDHRADIYALGCLLFKMIRGRPPFAAGRIRDVITAHMFQDPPALEDGASHTPHWLRHVVAWMLSKRPCERPESMSVVAREVNPNRSTLIATAAWMLRTWRQGVRARALPRMSASASVFKT